MRPDVGTVRCRQPRGNARTGRRCSSPTPAPGSWRRSTLASSPDRPEPAAAARQCHNINADTSGGGGAMSDGSTLRLPTPGAPGLPRRRRRRWPWVVLGIVLVLVALFVVLDRVAVAYAENQAAQQMTSQGFPTKPDVTIKGFPFLTQVAAKHINDVHVTASNVPAGPVK